MEELLSTERFTLRGWTEGDAPAFLDIYGRPEVVRFLGPAPRAVATLDDARELIARGRARTAAAERPLGLWAIVPPGQPPVGAALLLVLEDEHGPTDEVEVGWHLHPDWQGQGYATESARALLALAARADIEHVLAVIHPDNAPSHAVARRLEMEDEGLTERWYGTRLRQYRKQL